ncbi:hypothetical protein SIO17_21410 [Pseudoalteromonas piscicida]|uniref:Uncharacterized protein n=1 Tax=Pseudoalteromonas piscicida TaxID=43662 RepID=A0ABN5CJ97_PSEO7|nr:hypothetical protein [Pseudoalteromonas piscicida]ATD09670.1 hypothetical protein PPIS_b0529 [Pseudoalteromonas piscicida]WPU31579.1 hypothetical protein SIO17_21410 [Pseudoalteromonas piscicida]
MKSLFRLALLTSLVAMALVMTMSATVIELVMSLMLIILVCFSREDDNSQLLTLCFAIVFILSYGVVYTLENFIYPAVTGGFMQNTFAFGSQLSLSILLLFFLRHRMTIAVLLTRGKSPTVFEKNYAEGPLYLLVIIAALVDFFALMENFIRNLDHLGVPEETAKIFWEFTFFYDYFEYLKAIPMLLCVMMLYVGLVVRTKRQPTQS